MIEEISYHGWKRNLRLSGPTIELILTLEVGPRILRYAFHGGTNIFYEDPRQLGGTHEKEWQIRGGHRFWTAPEADHSYACDNGSVAWKALGENGVELTQPEDTAFSFQKTLRVELLADEVVRVTHLLTNTGQSPAAFTPWALSVLKTGGVALVPQPRLDLHPSEFPPDRQVKPADFLPNRELVLWPFTNLTDGRFSYGTHFLRVASNPTLRATKIGMRLPTGWAAYVKDGLVFAKHLVNDPAKAYPDRNCNFQIFTNPEIMELESLAPLEPLDPGAVRQHIEHWVLRPASDLQDEEKAHAFFQQLPVLP